MSSGADVLKDYLVRLGFEVDSAGYNNFQQILQRLEKSSDTTGKSLVKSVMKWSAAFTAGLGTVMAAEIHLARKFARLDMEYKKFALSNYMGEAQGKRVKIAQDVLGATLLEIQRIPELREKYVSLIKLIKEIETKEKDSKKQLKRIRDIEFAFQRLKVVGNAVLEEIIIKGMRKMTPEVDTLLNKLSQIEKWFIRNKGKVTDEGAKWFGSMPTQGKALAIGGAVLTAGAVGLIVKKVASKVAGLAGGVATGIGLQQAAGVTPVYVVNANEFGGIGGGKTTPVGVGSKLGAALMFGTAVITIAGTAMLIDEGMKDMTRTSLSDKVHWDNLKRFFTMQPAQYPNNPEWLKAHPEYDPTKSEYKQFFDSKGKLLPTDNKGIVINPTIPKLHSSATEQRTNGAYNNGGAQNIAINITPAARELIDVNVRGANKSLYYAPNLG